MWVGFFGAVAVIVGSILCGFAQEQKKENEKMNPTKPIPTDAGLRTKLTKDQYRVTREFGIETAFQKTLGRSYPSQRTGSAFSIAGDKG
jgi:hypothetical protein